MSQETDSRIEQCPELLAPAGSFEALKSAVFAGADAVYVGGSQFGARAFAENFTTEELLEALDFVHRHQVKLYMTVNTLLKEKEMKETLFSYLLPFYENGLDAVIVQDVGVLSKVREWFPDLEIHASTQMGILSKEGALLAKQQGVTRVVPGRELSLEEVRQITEIPNLEVECFVHGAMCYCYSGQCFLSSRIGGRSGNRGRCAQPCRLPYRWEGKGQENPHIFSMKDMCTVNRLPELIAAGIDSFKIEGRMKKPEYVMAVTGIYRKYMDLALESRKTGKPYTVDERDYMLLMQMYNRGGFHQGYYSQHNGRNMMECRRPNHQGVFLGTIAEIDKNYITFSTEWELYPGDQLEIRIPGDGVEMTSPVSVKQGEKARLKARELRKIKKGMPVYRMKSPALIEELKECFSHVGEIVLEGKGEFYIGRPASLRLCDKKGGTSITVYGAEVQKAVKQPVPREQIDKTLRQLGNGEYVLTDLKIGMDAEIFLPVKELKELRRRAIQEWEKQVLSTFHKKHSGDCGERTCVNAGVTSPVTCRMEASVHNREQLYTLTKHGKIKRLYVPLRLLEEIPEGCVAQVYAMLPRMFRKQQAQQLDFAWLCQRVTGFLVPTVDALAWLVSQTGQRAGGEQEWGVVLEDTLYAYNKAAIRFWQDYIENCSNLYFAGRTVPAELSLAELQELSGNGQIVPVYGRRVMMTSAQCLKKTGNACNQQQEVQSIKDRKGKGFLVESLCSDCYNIVWEEEPLSLSGCSKDVAALSPEGLRLDFTWETPEQTEKIVDAFYREYVTQEKEVPGVYGNRGHAYQSVE